MRTIAIRLKGGSVFTSAAATPKEARGVVDVINAAVADPAKQDCEITIYPDAGGRITFSISALSGAAVV